MSGASVKDVIFRVDSSPEIGRAQITRCLALAEALRHRGARARFVQDRAASSASLVRAHGFDVMEIDAPDAALPPETAGADWLIVDHYGIDASWEKSAAAGVRRVLVIDDRGNRPHHCALFLDPHFLPSMKPNPDTVLPSSCRRLLGPAFALLRPEFDGVSPRPRDGHLKRVLISFGGGDPEGLTQRAMKALGAAPSKPAVGVLVGPAHLHREAIEADCRAHGFTLHLQADQTAPVMDAADLIVGSEAMLWERCKLGVPSITVVVDDQNQEMVEALVTSGATVNLGLAVEFSDKRLLEEIQRLAGDPEAVRQLSGRSLELMGGPGAGAARVVDAMFSCS